MPFVKHTDVADGGNGAASNAHDFIISKVVPFITSVNHFPVAADRWTLERTDAVAANEVEVFISPPTNAPDAPAIAWHTREDAIFMYAGTSYVAGTASYALPGNTRQFPGSGAEPNPDFDPTNDTDRKSNTWDHSWPTTGLAAHWLYAPPDGKYCMAVVQLATRRFRHIFFGQYEKFQPLMVGGAFFGMQYWANRTTEIDDPYNSSREHAGPFCSHNTSLGAALNCGVFRAEGLRTGAPVGAAAEWFYNGTVFHPSNAIVRPATGTWDTQNNTAIATARGWCNGLGSGGPGGDFLFQIKQSLLANIKPLIPIMVWGSGFAEGQDRWMPLGQIPDIWRIHMQGFTEGQELVVGSDTYTLLPFINSDQVSTLSNEDYSGWDGLAIRQRP